MASLNDKDLKNYPQPTAGFKASNGTTEVAVIAAPGGNKRLRLTGLFIDGTAIAADNVIFRNGISGATFLALHVGPSTAAPTYASRDIVNQQGIFLLSANSALMASVAAGSAAAVNIVATALIEEVI